MLLSGCSGGGKSSLLDELSRLGFSAVPEPGRRIVDAALPDGACPDPRVLPWHDPAGFARAAVALAIGDRRRLMVDAPGDWVFFDRGLPDAAVALAHAAGESLDNIVAGHPAYALTVFLVPPWPALFAHDGARRHDLDEAIAEYDRLVSAYGHLGYRTVVLPRCPVAGRASLVLRTLGLSA